MNFEHRTPNVEFSIWRACGNYLKIHDNKLIFNDKFIIEEARRHPHSMLKVQCSMFDVQFNQHASANPGDSCGVSFNQESTIFPQ